MEARKWVEVRKGKEREQKGIGGVMIGEEHTEEGEGFRLEDTVCKQAFRGGWEMVGEMCVHWCWCGAGKERRHGGS